MKTGIHPEYVETTVTCTCGSTFTTRSTETSGKISADVCSQCHPFYTGKQKILDTGGRVARFNARYAKKDTKSPHRCARRDCPSRRGQASVAHVGHHAIDASNGRIERHSCIVDGADTDVSCRMGKYLLVVNGTFRQCPSNGPKPLDQTVENIASGKTCEIDVTHHLRGVKNAASIVGNRPQHG